MWVQEPNTKSQGPSFLQEMFGQVWRSLWPRPLALGHRLLGLQRTPVDTSCSRSLGDTRLPQKGGWGGSSMKNRSHEERRWELGKWKGPEPLRKAEGRWEACNPGWGGRTAFGFVRAPTPRPGTESRFFSLLFEFSYSLGQDPGLRSQKPQS